MLKKFQLAKYFTVVVSADDVNGKSKPRPDIFLFAAKKLKTMPSSCMVVEDSENGIKAAKSAGMFCLAFNEKHLRENFKTYPSDHTINNLSEIILLANKKL